MAAVLLGATLLTCVESALAHSDEDYFDYWQDLSQWWRFTAGFPSGGGQRDRLRDGLRQWAAWASP